MSSWWSFIRFFIFILKFFPKKALSSLVGVLVRLKLPSKGSLFFNKVFVWWVKIDMSEAEKSLREYSTIEDLFARKLKQGSRPIQGEICSPCDGLLQSSHKLEKEGEALQAKGVTYSVLQLIYGKKEKIESKFSPGWAVNIYLSPHHYHRVHSPVEGFLISVTHIRGDLWPVNPLFTKYVPNLFDGNERVIFELESVMGGYVYVVMVGALNVGRIKTVCGVDLLTNNSWSQKEKVYRTCLQQKIKVNRGEELGVFLLGSTTIVIFDKSFLKKHIFKTHKTSQSIRLGECLHD